MTVTCHILGASGTIGSTIADRLSRRRDVAVRRWDSTSCDLLDDAAVRSTFAGGAADDRFVFCAARTRRHGESDADGDANRRMLDHLLGAIDGRCGQLVLLSSVDVYGRSADGLVLDESSSLAPDGPYAASKAWCEQRLTADDVPFPVTVFRLPGVYGVDDAQRSTAGALSRRILNGDPIELPTRAVARDFVCTADIAALVDAALVSTITGTYVVATGQSLPLRDIVGLLAQGLQRRAVLHERSRSEPRDIDLRFDPRRLRAAFPGVALTSMAEGLVRYGEWARMAAPDHGVNQK